ncbi:actin-binding FH2 [Backusella circina FSU 941]|nr:actin-binding FH2 [Backusella circina FSU 941]
MFDKVRNKRKREPSQKKKLKNDTICDQKRLSDKSPEYFIEKLSQHKNINAKMMARLELSLRCESLKWLRRFVDIEGMKLLTSILEQYHEDTKCKRRGVDLHMECELLKCFKALLNNTVGASEASSHPAYILQLIISIKSASLHNRRLVLEVLIFICYFSFPQGQTLVLDALSHLSDISETPNQFGFWLSTWKSAVAKNTLDPQMMEYSLCNMMLVNAIINVTESLQERIQLRQQLNQAGLSSLIEGIQQNTLIDQQVQEYKFQETCDEETMCYQPNSGRIFKNLLDPYHLLEMVLESIEGSACYDYFLDILQRLLLQDHLDEQDKVTYYERIDSCVHHSTMESPVESLQHARKELQELKKKYDVLVKGTAASKSGNQEQVHHLEEKVAATEDLLRIARSTTFTLQEKLRSIQTTYEENINRLEEQLEMFCDIIEGHHSENDTIVLNKKEYAKLFERIDSKRQLDKTSPEKEQINNERRRSSTFITEEFKSKLAMQFSSSNISDFAGQDRKTNRHTILSFSNQNLKESFKNFSTSSENSSSKLLSPVTIKREPSALSKRAEQQNNNRRPKAVSEAIPEEESIPSASSSTTSITSSTGSSGWSQKTYCTQETILIEAEKNHSTLPYTTLSFNNKSHTPITPHHHSATNSTLPKRSSSIPCPPPLPPTPPSLSLVIPDNSKEPPIPPPPPLPSAIMTSPTRKQLNRYPSIKTRVLQWQKLHKDNIEPTVWSQGIIFQGASSGNQLESKLDEAGIFKQMEETFSQLGGASNKPKQKWEKKKLDEISLIETQKSSNLNISVLARLKHLSMEQIKSGIFNLDEKLFDEVILWNLYHNLPETNEIKSLKEYNPYKDKLSMPDAFCLELIDIPAFKERIESMLLKLTFSDRIAHINKSMRQIMEASDSLKNSEAIKEFLNLVLLVGNFLNGSNFQGGAFGIRIASINKLIETKSSKNDTTLLHFMMDMIEKQFPNVFASLIPDMALCSDASRSK